MTMPDNRPLSPHLQVYKPQLTSMLSILHRITGFGLAVGAVMGTWWLVAIMSGTSAYECFHDFAKSFIGQLMLFCWLYAFVYHFLNGIRHRRSRPFKRTPGRHASRNRFRMAGGAPTSFVGGRGHGFGPGMASDRGTGGMGPC